MSKKQRLELTWVGKENRPKLEPRILLEDSTLSYHAAHRVTDQDQFDNILIQGDNLLALKALEAEYTGKIKCVFIDPPYNTGSAFTHYDDGIEHSLWLSLLRDRLEILSRLMDEEGSIWITVDDNEAHYLKVLCDEIFGRRNFAGNVIWEKIFSPKGTARGLSANHDHVLCYAKDFDKWKRNLLPRTEKMDSRYKNPDNDPRGPWSPDNLTARNFYGAGQYSIITPKGRLISGPPKGTFWRVSEDKFKSLDKDNRIWWGENRDNQPRLKRFLSDVMSGTVPQTIWLQTEVGNTQEAKKEANAFVLDGQEIFDTPKPERLIKRVLEIATNTGDLVLDSFAGSGTTGAVAQKMGRRWIMVELGEHAKTHIVPRLQKVADGEDQGGITKAVEWKGGGGFRFYTLAPSLLEKDRWDNWVINKAYNPEMLAEALCKLEGFTYAPNPEVYWQQGFSNETDFLYVTTSTLTHAQLEQLSEEVGPDRTLLVLCPAFKGTAPFDNLTVRKIPKHVLSRCEWGHDDYSLRVENLPQAPVPANTQPSQLTLF
ncbi:site-specific DNA-methyltransferase [Hymenobacter glacieicola]|uniref:site-specific DNA-methyltransferase (adenine-specific) n=1 Tax=Hymenobacter glacieicola TaxID=1562124 RepID=A0ABQ1WKL8_9BACT|nr:site-specific DNA-methyltransferase [Hymenobacter glacieicola]GGG35533.1 site-specific DNA-methyltransferase [Hymenobacter glacieicola]